VPRPGGSAASPREWRPILTSWAERATSAVPRGGLQRFAAALDRADHRRAQR